MKTLDKIGLPYVGTCHPEQERQEAFYFELDGAKFAVVAYTYGINNRKTEDEKFSDSLNCLAKAGNRVCGKKIYPTSILDKLIKNEDRRKNIKRFFNIPTLPIQVDTLINHDMVYEYTERFCDDIKKAKEKADFVICYPHTGGQFNIEVGDFTKTVFEKALTCGADAILASHSHCVQKAEFCGNVLCAYSLGNFNMVGDTLVTVKKFFPEYGLAMHLYMDGNRVDKVTFSITKAVKKGKKQIVTWPVDVLYGSLKSKRQQENLKNEVKQILAVVTGKEYAGNIIQKEYTLE
jgi:poly-gamma-glutamate synthesis protein (capsule biosynthesis protein)